MAFLVPFFKNCQQAIYDIAAPCLLHIWILDADFNRHFRAAFYFVCTGTTMELQALIPVHSLGVNFTLQPNRIA